MPERAQPREALRPPRRFALILTAALAAAASAPAAARAAEAPPAPGRAGAAASDDEKVRAEAARRFAEGQQAFLEERWGEAEIAYLKAFALSPSYDVAANLAQVELLLNKPREAAQHAAYSLKRAPISLDPEQRRRLAALLAEAQKPLATLRVTTDVAESEVWIDGERVASDTAVREAFVDPGTHRIVASRPGHGEATAVVTVDAGTSKDIALRLSAPPAGTRATAAPPEAVETQASRPGDRRKGAAFALGAAAGVTLAAAVGLTFASNAASDDTAARRAAIRDEGGQCAAPPAAFAGPCAELSDAGARTETLGNAAALTYAASGVLAVSAVVLALWPRDAHDARSAVRALPALHAHGAGVHLQGAW